MAARTGVIQSRQSSEVGATGAAQALSDPGFLPSSPKAPRRLLMICSAFPPTGGSGVQRSVKFAKYLPQFGWTPIVWACAPMDDMPRDPSLVDDLPEAVRVIRTDPGGFTRGVYRLSRRLQERGGVIAPLASSVNWRARARLAEQRSPDPFMGWARRSVEPLVELIERERIDAIYSTYSPASNHLLAMWVKERTALPWVADFRDLWTDDCRYREADAHQRAVHRHMEKDFLRKADAVIGVTGRQTTVLAQHVPDQADKFVTITNGFDPEDWIPPAPTSGPHDEFLRAERHTEGRPFVITHVGRLDRARMHDALFEALRIFATSTAGGGRATDRGGSTVLRIVGHVDRSVLEAIRATGIPIEWTGYVSHVDAVYEMRAADALVLPVPDGRHGDTIIPGKLFEYLAAQRPILAVGPEGGACAEIIAECEAGAYVGPDAAAIADGLLRFVDAWAGGKQIPGCRPDRLHPYSRVTLTYRLAGVLDRLVTADADGAQDRSGAARLSLEAALS